MDRRLLLVRAAALCSAGAAAIHFGVTPGHFAQWWLFGAFFVLCAAGQAVWALLGWTRATNALLIVGAVGNLLVALLWVVTRTVGLPIGPGVGDAEPVGVADVACTALEVAVVLAAGVLLMQRPSGAPRPFPARLAVGTTAAVGALVLLASGVALAAPSEHGDEHAAAHESASGKEHSHGHEGGKKHREPNLPDVSKATADDTAKAKKLLADSIAETKKYRDTDEAEAAGYDVDKALERWAKKHPDAAKEKKPIRALHVGKPATKKDDKVADPSAPETLIYRRDEKGKLALVGVMYSVRKGQDPPDVAGPYTRWHTHEFCVGRDGKKVGGKQGEQGKKAGHEHGAACPSGTTKGRSGSMMHVWFVKEAELRKAYARFPPAKAIEEYQKTLS